MTTKSAYEGIQLVSGISPDELADLLEAKIATISESADESLAELIGQEQTNTIEQALEELI